MIRFVLLGFVLVSAIGASYAADVKVHKNENTGLLSWMMDTNGFRIELIQLLPDFVRAIYAKHNFPKAEVEKIAGYCVFGTILKNTSQQHLSYRVSDWRYRETGKSDSAETFPVKTKTQWLEQWRKEGITFSWTLLPDIGEFAVGDWQQGFTTIKLPRTAHFDLIYTWQLDGVTHEATLPDLSCTPDLEMQPE